MNASLQLRADIRYVQRMTVLEGVTYRILFLSPVKYIVRREAPFLKNIKTVELPDGVQCVVQTPAIEFSPRGTLEKGAQTIQFKNKRYSQQMTILPDTGRPEIKEIHKY
jgi:hypothetical protein